MSIDNMISELAAAKVAMEENPQLKAQVQSLKDEMSYKAHYIAGLEGKHEGLAARHEDATARIAKLEAELEQSRFRELATRSKLEKFISSVNEAVHEVIPPSMSPADAFSGDVVEQSAAVLKSPQDYIETMGDVTDKAIGLEPEVEAGMIEDASAMLHQSNPDNPFDENGNTKPEWNTPQIDDRGQYDNYLEAEAAKIEAEQKAAQVFDREVETMNLGVEHLSRAEAEAVANEAERTAKAEDLAPIPTAGAGSGTTGEVTQHKPFAGKHYSMKPTVMPWPTWVDLGGMRPWWLDDNQLNALRQGSALAS